MSEQQNGVQSTAPSRKTTASHLKPGDPSQARAKGVEAKSRRLLTLRGRMSDRSMQIITAIPARYQDRALRVLTKEASMRVAIRAHCESCVGYEDTAAAVGGCRTPSCMLHPFRPYQKVELEDEA